MTLVDAGPLVAILHKDDKYHDRCVQALRTLPAPLVTTWAVITEAMDLLAFSPVAQDALLEMMHRDVLTLDHRDFRTYRLGGRRSFRIVP